MAWNRDVTAARSATGNRLLGGPPLTVALRLLFASLVVGALLMWLNVEPMDLVRHAILVLERLWAMGFEAFGQAGHYILAGAVIVLPIWLATRLLTGFRSR